MKALSTCTFTNFLLFVICFSVGIIFINGAEKVDASAENAVTAVTDFRWPKASNNVTSKDTTITKLPLQQSKPKLHSRYEF